MSRERIAGLALLSYPAAARAARGEEMLATLHDVSAGSRWGFAREIADLLRLGLRTRATATASVGVRRLLVSLSTVGLSVVVQHHDASAPASLFVAAAAVAMAIAVARTRHLRRPARR